MSSGSIRPRKKGGNTVGRHITTGGNTASNAANVSGNAANDKSLVNYDWAKEMLNWSDGSYSTNGPTDIKVNIIISLFIFSVTLVLYALTQYPSVSGGDAGELIINAHQLGIAHPPGYPLFTMLGRFFDKFVPYGTVGWRVALMSSFFGAVGSVAIFLTVKLWVNDNWCAVVSSLMFTFSPLIWCYHIQGEVFSINNMFVAIIMLLSVWFVRTRIYENERFNASFWTSEKIAYLSAFACALGLTNQHTLVLIVVPFAFWLMFIGGRDQLWSIRTITNLTMSALAGLSPYLYLILAPRIRIREYSWGNTGEISGFITHFLRKEYGTLQLYSGDSGNSTLISRILLYFNNLFDQFGYFGAILSFIGIISLLLGSNLKNFQWRSIGTMIIFTFLFYITFFFNLCNLPIEKPLYKGVFLRFFMQPNVIVSIAIGLGLKYLFNFINSKSPTLKKILLPAVAILLISYQIGSNYQLQDQSENYSFINYGHAILDNLPKNTLLLVGGDLVTNVPQYLKLCEGVRPDVDILSLEEMSWDWFTITQGPLLKNVNFPGSVYHPHRPEGFSLKTFLDRNQHRPIYLAGDFKYGDYTHQAHYFTLPRGFASQILPIEKSRLNYKTILKEYQKFPFFPLPNDTVKYPNDSWEFFMVNDVASSLERSVENLLSSYLQEFTQEGEDALRLSVEILQKVLTIRDTKCWTLKHLGVASDHLRYRIRTKDGSYEKYSEILFKSWTRYLEICANEKDQDWDTISKVINSQQQ
ncbi:transmembrane protein [Heterostelium album PN500]|uniref:Transmembrane protein n=1 Tax=Heterostelium pallidum (strain ATCC 26659 / Pp 5 / PN500) TaxID=670386 RepID=D3BML5_HETP5|nr:transmembrane protein [Heterostelium album PN500]EFA77227.1 transmembrane protein [Heterostelium album PN500]|eukprot:XP_020429356.1 transmembrane protein [Heterostelium album PN500]